MDRETIGTYRVHLRPSKLSKASYDRGYKNVNIVLNASSAHFYVGMNG